MTQRSGGRQQLWRRSSSHLTSCLPLMVAAFIMSAPPAMGLETQSELSPDTQSKLLPHWLAEKTQWFYRYLPVIQQAAHDYSYDYKTPLLLVPVAMDLFHGYFARVLEAEARVLYPPLQERMTADQRQTLSLMEKEFEIEKDLVKASQRTFEAYERGGKRTAVGDALDELARMINRVLVLQDRLLSAFDTLSPQEDAAILQQITAFERQEFGAAGRAPYEELLLYLEREVRAMPNHLY